MSSSTVRPRSENRGRRIYWNWTAITTLWFWFFNWFRTDTDTAWCWKEQRLWASLDSDSKCRKHIRILWTCVSMTNKNGCIDISFSTIGMKKGATWDNLFQHIPKLSQNTPNIFPGWRNRSLSCGKFRWLEIDLNAIHNSYARGTCRFKKPCKYQTLL